MLRWQHKNGRNTIFWGQLCALSGLVHLVVVMCVLFVYSDRLSHYTLTMHEAMPAVATVVVLAPTHMASRVSGNAPHAPVQSAQSSTRIVASVPTTKQRTITHKAVKKKIIKKQKPAKQVKKVTPKKADPARKAQAVKAVQKAPATIEKKAVFPSPAVAERVAPPADAILHAPASDSIMIAYADARTAHQYAILQNELSKHWAPPPGVADECTCRLTVCIDRAGAVSDVVVEESSGVLIFDIMARTALLAVEWPVWTRGASITITFKP
jgi:outer membrane biosynthesis protein TonB